MKSEDISVQVIPIIKSQGVLKAALFGSVAREEANSRSDIDLLVELEDGKSLLDLIRLQFAIEDKLGKKVDILTYDSIHPLLRDTILKEQKIIYEKR